MKWIRSKCWNDKDSQLRQDLYRLITLTVHIIWWVLIDGKMSEQECHCSSVDMDKLWVKTRNFTRFGQRSGSNSASCNLINTLHFIILYTLRNMYHHHWLHHTFELFIERISEWTKITLDFSSNFDQNKFFVKCVKLEKYDHINVHSSLFWDISVKLIYIHFLFIQFCISPKLLIENN